MKKILPLALILLFISYLSAITIQQKLVNDDNLNIGDRFQLQIYADVPLKSVVVPDTLTSFKIIEVEKKKEPSGKTWLQLTIVPILTGSLSFPKLQVIPEISDGQTYFTDAFRVIVIPVRAENDTTLVDIKPLAKYPLQLPIWVYYLLIAFIIVGIIYLILNRRNRGGKDSTVKETIPSSTSLDPPWKIALKQLDELLSQNLIQKGEYIRHHYELSLILRQFLERKYRFPAVEMTTSEIQQVAERLYIASSQEVLNFLKYCDKVKFAKYIPSQEEIEEYENWLRSWVQSFELVEAQQKLAHGGIEHA